MSAVVLENPAQPNKLLHTRHEDDLPAPTKKLCCTKSDDEIALPGREADCKEPAGAISPFLGECWICETTCDHFIDTCSFGFSDEERDIDRALRTYKGKMKGYSWLCSKGCMRVDECAEGHPGLYEGIYIRSTYDDDEYYGEGEEPHATGSTELLEMMKI